MSLVGTRPPTVEEVAQYEDRHRTRLAINLTVFPCHVFLLICL